MELRAEVEVPGEGPLGAVPYGPSAVGPVGYRVQNDLVLQILIN